MPAKFERKKSLCSIFGPYCVRSAITTSNARAGPMIGAPKGVCFDQGAVFRKWFS